MFWLTSDRSSLGNGCRRRESTGLSSRIFATAARAAASTSPARLSGLYDLLSSLSVSLSSEERSLNGKREVLFVCSKAVDLRRSCALEV